MPLIPEFTQADIDRKIDTFTLKKNRKILNILSYIGEDFVNNARMNHTYKDQTGNLTASIGYIIGLNGVKIKENYTGKTPEGTETGKQVANEILKKNNKGYVLIVTAGMEYAAAVESRGFDVISGSMPLASELSAYLKRELK